MVSEVEKLLNIVATMATSSATPERSFSTLKRVNTWLRTTMGQDRLSNLALLHFHQKETEQLSTKEIMRCFIMAKSNSRQLVFGQVIEELEKTRREGKKSRRVRSYSLDTIKEKEKREKERRKKEKRKRKRKRNRCSFQSLTERAQRARNFFFSDCQDTPPAFQPCYALALR